MIINIRVKLDNKGTITSVKVNGKEKIDSDELVEISSHSQEEWLIYEGEKGDIILSRT